MNIEKRSIVTCILLSIVTCGIYQIYWIVKLGKEAVSVKDPNDSGLTEILCMLFLPFLGDYLAGKKLYEGASAMGIQISDNSIVYLVLGLFGLGIVSISLIQNDLNKIADYVTPQGGYYPPNNGGYYDPNGQNNNDQQF